MVEAKFDAARSTLVGTKLTGNDFVGAGRVSWARGWVDSNAKQTKPNTKHASRATLVLIVSGQTPDTRYQTCSERPALHPLAQEVTAGGGCRVVSSLWQHVYTPRWDACAVDVSASSIIV